MAVDKANETMEQTAKCVPTMIHQKKTKKKKKQSRQLSNKRRGNFCPKQTCLSSELHTSNGNYDDFVSLFSRKNNSFHYFFYWLWRATTTTTATRTTKTNITKDKNTYHYNKYTWTKNEQFLLFVMCVVPGHLCFMIMHKYCYIIIRRKGTNESFSSECESMENMYDSHMRVETYIPKDSSHTRSLLIVFKRQAKAEYFTCVSVCDGCCVCGTVYCFFSLFHTY